MLFIEQLFILIINLLVHFIDTFFMRLFLMLQSIQLHYASVLLLEALFRRSFCIPWLLMGLTFIPLVYTFTINHLEATDTKNYKLYEQLYKINQKQI